MYIYVCMQAIVIRDVPDIRLRRQDISYRVSGKTIRHVLPDLLLKRG